MKRIVLTFGLIAGAIVTTMVVVMVPLYMRGTVDFSHGEVIGYSSMVLAFTLVFFGIRTYRDNVLGGAITFGKAFQVGILIVLVASAVYVVVWEIVFFGFLPDFPDRYTEYLISTMRNEGAAAEAIAARQREMEDFKRLYANPLINIAFTFLEIFPVGLVMTLVSAAILRRPQGHGAVTATA